MAVIVKVPGMDRPLTLGKGVGFNIEDQTLYVLGEGSMPIAVFDQWTYAIVEDGDE